MQNYINMFRICVLILTFYIHSLTYCKNFSIALTFKTNQHIGFFSKCRLTYRIFPIISADIFQNAISNAGGDVVTVRAWKRNVGWHFRNVGPTFKTLPTRSCFCCSHHYPLSNSIGIFQKHAYDEEEVKACILVN